MQVHELNHVALHVRDISRSVHFYEAVLGLPRMTRPDFPFGGAWFALGTQELHLILDETIPEGEQHHGHFALRVENIAAVRRALEARGVAPMSGPAPRPDGALQVFLADPDGHMIELLDTSTMRHADTGDDSCAS